MDDKQIRAHLSRIESQLRRSLNSIEQMKREIDRQEKKN